MKSLVALGILFFALSFCGLGDRLKEVTGGDSDTTETTTKTEGADENSGDGDEVKTAKLTSDMESMLDGETATWEEQGMTWKLPNGWPKMSVSKTSFQYGSPAKGFLIASISSLGSDFPVDT
ncbi:MAG: hypothetical protein OEQ28_10160, partial [Acidobacteriota bacterium]|nr:hypothetical protein [Acidobacteriota bacterium]